MSWHVLYVRPRAEKKLAEYAGARGIAYYLPLRRETKVYQRRKVTVEKPLFPGYFFSSFDAREKEALLKTHHVVRIIAPPQERRLLRELAQVRRVLRVDPTLRTCSALKTGTWVRITAGPFRGVQGVVRALKNPMAVILNVEMIGQGVAVEVDRDYVEVVT